MSYSLICLLAHSLTHSYTDAQFAIFIILNDVELTIYFRQFFVLQKWLLAKSKLVAWIRDHFHNNAVIPSEKLIVRWTHIVFFLSFGKFHTILYRWTDENRWLQEERRAFPSYLSWLLSLFSLFLFEIWICESSRHSVRWFYIVLFKSYYVLKRTVKWKPYIHAKSLVEKLKIDMSMTLNYKTHANHYWIQ